MRVNADDMFQNEEGMSVFADSVPSPLPASAATSMAAATVTVDTNSDTNSAQEQQQKQNQDSSNLSECYTEKEIGAKYSMLGARGGPLFLPGLVSPAINARQFEATLTARLHVLRKELDESELYDCCIDVSVDDLKIVPDDVILDQVLKEAFKHNSQSTQPSGPQQEEPLQLLTRESLSQSKDDGSCLTIHKGKKRGRMFDRDIRAAELQGEEFSKCESLTRIKQQKEEEKRTAKLHCLKSNENENENEVAKSERQERLKALRFITSNLKTKHVEHTEFEPVCQPEIVMCIEFYHNFKKEQKVQEFLVLGRQPLTVLRDKFYCLTDQLMQKAQQSVSSGYFLMENVFYNDLRGPNSIDYSKPILDWVENNRDEALEKWKSVIVSGIKKKQKTLFRSSLPSARLPSFFAADMATTCFADLNIRLGVRYLYCHQGDCKHHFVIRDMRLFHSEDDLNKRAYPLLTFQPRMRHRKCNICDIYRAKRVTYDDKWAPKNPSYFCDNCYYLLHYSTYGSLLYDDFRVYNYYHE